MPVLVFTKSQFGAILVVDVAPSVAAAEQGAPSPLSIRTHSVPMLVDTGSDRTILEEELIASWGLVYTSAGWASTINGKKPIKSFEVRLTLGQAGTPQSLIFDPLIVSARTSRFEGVPYHGLLGQDVLNRCLFTYNGPGHECTLAF